jgi:maltose O-acetyltransferase
MKERPKTEKEKMLANELYLASDPELKAESWQAFQLTRLYNGEAAEDLEQRAEILRQLLGAVGNNVTIVPPFHCDYGRNIYTGDNFYMNYGGVILDCNTVHIGDNVLCAPYVQIYTAYHPVDPAERLTGLELAAPIAIGNNVWIGGGAIICPGVTIGDNTTIGAGSVVTKDIPANVVAVGNPCKVIRTLENNPPS